jgi:hypothetical protein
MGEGDLARRLLDGSDNHIDDVPIGCKGAVGERFLEWSCGMDALQRWVVIATDLELPRWSGIAKLIQMM